MQAKPPAQGPLTFDAAPRAQAATLAAQASALARPILETPAAVQSVPDAYVPPQEAQAPDLAVKAAPALKQGLKARLNDAAAAVMHFGMKVAAKLCYRIEVQDAARIPAAGAALLVCNHQSIIDWLIMGAISPRPINFVMYYKYFNMPVLKQFAQMAGAIPIAGRNEDPAIFQAAFDRISSDLKAGRLVLIFPEGQITRDGKMNPFKKGVEHALARDPVPVVPMGMKGLWDSSFSTKDGHPVVESLKFWTHRFRPSVKVSVGSPLAPETVTAAALETVVRGLWEGVDLRE